MTDSIEDTLGRLEALVGEWTTESTHPALPGTVVNGRSSFEWLEGKKFLIWRADADHPDFPTAISMIGFTKGLQTHSFDSRGVHRIMHTRISEETWEFDMPREQPSDKAFAEGSPGFALRFVGTFADGGNTILGLVRLSFDEQNWRDDLRVTYRRVPARTQ